MAKRHRRKNTGIKLIKKANKLVESRYKFDIWETRLFLSVLAQINRDDEDFQVYRIWYKDVKKLFGLTSAQSYELLRNAARGLMSKVFFVESMVKGKKRETEFHIIRSVNYLSDEEEVDDNQDYIDITVEPEMKPLLLQLGQNYKGLKGEGFTAYDLRNVTKLGPYHVRIYELLKQYQRIGHRKLFIDDIKRMLEIGSEYPLFGNFFQKVIKPSREKINNHTDLIITKMEKVKQGRKVVALYFEFREKTETERNKARGITEQLSLSLDKPPSRGEKAPKEVNTTDANQLFDKYYDVVVKGFGVTPSSFLNLCKSVDDIKIEQAISVTRRKKANNEIIRSVPGFFIKALKGEYTDPKEEAKKRKAELKMKQAVILTQIEDLEIDRENQINEAIREVVHQNPEITQLAIEAISANASAQKIVELKQKKLKRALTIEDYRQDKSLRNLVKLYISKLYPEPFKEIEKNFKTKMRSLKQQVGQ